MGNLFLYITPQSSLRLFLSRLLVLNLISLHSYLAHVRSCVLGVLRSLPACGMCLPVHHRDIVYLSFTITMLNLCWAISLVWHILACIWQVLLREQEARETPKAVRLAYSKCLHPQGRSLSLQSCRATGESHQQQVMFLFSPPVSSHVQIWGWTKWFLRDFGALEFCVCGTCPAGKGSLSEERK